jgi:acyl-CoA synthetase (AMP-forming)/AMP-acid ligase II
MQDQLNLIFCENYFHQGYGLTETCGPIAGENSFHKKLGSVGPALPTVTLKIDNPDQDEIGEILVNSPSTMFGYYENENAIPIYSKKEDIESQNNLMANDALRVIAVAYKDVDEFPKVIDMMNKKESNDNKVLQSTA